LRIRVEDIPTHGRTVQVELETEWARSAVATALEGQPDVLQGSVEVRPGSNATHARVVIALRASAPSRCDRCGEAVSHGVELHSELLYQPESAEVSEVEVELGEDDLDVGWYRDGHLSLPDLLMEAVALELPSRVLCADTEACDARTRELLAAASEGLAGHPAFAALKTLKK